MTSTLPSKAFWHGKRVLLTGHTGFKGAWAALWLTQMGARVTGLALPPAPGPSLFALAGDGANAGSHFADLRDREAVAGIVGAAQPEIILHLAAQALVRRSYREPVDTFATNVQGTVHVLEAARHVKGLKTVLVVTSDKVYENDGSGGPFPEESRVGGHDPYSASKAAAEIAVAAYRHSFFRGTGDAGASARVATARGGNVIGGGDFSEDRIVPDIWRAQASNQAVVLRYPDATRPWQHVLDCLSGYFVHAEALATGRAVPEALNFGPREKTGLPVRDLVTAMQQAIGASQGWTQAAGPHPPEMPALGLDCTLAGRTLGWHPLLDSQATIDWTASWYRAFAGGADPRALTLQQIGKYVALA